jgi:carbonic anhydrase
MEKLLMNKRLLVRLNLASLIMVLPLAVNSCSQPATETQPKSVPQETPQAKTRGVAPGQADPHWDYGSDEGPASWGKLNPKFSACGDGKSQSPIDIDRTVKADLPSLKAEFKPAQLKIVHHEHMADVINTGHSIQVNYTEGDTLQIGDAQFELLQYHFHSPSEHTVSGKRFPMEMHLVHQSADKKLAVAGVFIEEGEHNAAFDPVWANLPPQKSVETHLEHLTVNVDDLLPKNRSTYRYDGSLTTPPCSEGVRWMLFTTPIQLSAKQIGAFRDILKGNSRPVQPLNGRAVVTDRVVETVAP